MAWLLVPLFVLLMTSAYTTYRYASHLAESERDLTLEEIADDFKDAISGTLMSGGNIDAAAQTLGPILRDTVDQRSFAIYDSKGTLVAGDARLTPMRPMPQSEERAVFDNTILDGKKVRRAAMRGDEEGLPGFEIQVAETTQKRERLTMRISRGVLVPQAIVLVFSFPLVWFGISKGLRPLEQLRERITRRSAQDLDALSADGTPVELQPVVTALNGLLSRVRKAQDEQRRFTAEAAHQIKTPLAVLTAEIELAMSDDSCRTTEPILRRLRLAASRLTHLVQQLLALARSESSQAQTDTLFDLSELAREVTGDYVGVAASRRIDLGFEGFEQPIPLRANVILIKEAMKNLIDNALKFTPEGGIVTTSVQASPPVFSVADSGPGIPEDQRPLIFQRFHRVAGESAINGSGLGLAIVQEVARRHGATVTVGNSALGGTLFELRFAEDAASPSGGVR